MIQQSSRIVGSQSNKEKTKFVDDEMNILTIYTDSYGLYTRWAFPFLLLILTEKNLFFASLWEEAREKKSNSVREKEQLFK